MLSIDSPIFIFFRVSSSNVGETQNLSFCKGLKLLESNCVDNVLQVGKLKLEIFWKSFSTFHKCFKRIDLLEMYINLIALRKKSNGSKNVGTIIQYNYLQRTIEQKYKESQPSFLPIGNLSLAQQLCFKYLP